MRQPLKPKPIGASEVSAHIADDHVEILGHGRAAAPEEPRQISIFVVTSAAIPFVRAATVATIAGRIVIDNRKLR